MASSVRTKCRCAVTQSALDQTLQALPGQIVETAYGPVPSGKGPGLDQDQSTNIVFPYLGREGPDGEVDSERCKPCAGLWT